MRRPRGSRSGQRAGPRTLIVVGNGMVSHRLCRRLAKPAEEGRFRIVVIGEEPHVAYDRIRLSESPSPAIDALLLDAPGWYTRHGITLRTGEQVVGVLPQDQRVELASGERLSYDALIFATGSVPFVPPIEGLAESEQIQVFRTFEDLTRLRKDAEPGGTAAIIGGGLLGLETAKVLSDAGVRTHVLEASSYLMPRQLDAASAAVLDERVQALGVRTHLGVRTRHVETDADGVSLYFEGGLPPLTVDKVVVAAGTRPRDELAREAGIAVAARGGIIIDEQLRTSAPNVYAIGECISFKGDRIGLVAPGYDMADVLAANLCGARRRFLRVDRSCHLKLLGVPVAAAGLYDVDVRAVGVDVDGGRRTLMLDGRRLVGVTSVGDWPGMARVQDAAVRRLRLSDRQLQRFRDEGELWARDDAINVESWPETTVICNCVGVTRGQLSDCLKRGGKDVVSLGEATGAGTTCGSCVPLLSQLCKQPSTPTPGAGRGTLLVSSVLALLLSALFVALSPVPFADSVQQTLRAIDRLFRDEALKQWSGYGVVAVTVLGGLLSLRKRTGVLRRGAFGVYRGWHALAGFLALSGLVAHTGMRFGANLNLALMAVFTGACAVGALTGVAAALETTPSSSLAHAARRLRRPLTWAHLLLFWPLPLLVGLHVFSVYYF